MIERRENSRAKLQNKSRINCSTCYSASRLPSSPAHHVYKSSPSSSKTPNFFYFPSTILIFSASLLKSLVIRLPAFLYSTSSPNSRREERVFRLERMGMEKGADVVIFFLVKRDGNAFPLFDRTYPCLSCTSASRMSFPILLTETLHS